MKTRTIRTALLLLTFLGSHAPASARGGFASENPFAAEHIDTLPPDIRRSVAARQRGCGTEPAAAHGFSTSIDASGRRFVSLHFDKLRCQSGRIFCGPSGCLHEVFVETGGRHRKVFAAFVGEMRMTDAEGRAGLEIWRDGRRTLLRWNGSGFVRASGRSGGE